MESDAVERSLRGEAPQILGKDEVASSNLASSSKNRQASSDACRFLLITSSLGSTPLDVLSLSINSYLTFIVQPQP